MSNLLTGMNGIITINGSSRQICQVNNHERNEYELIYEPTELIGNKNYILIHVAYNQDITHTLFFPIQSLGKQVVPFEIDAENILYFDVNFYGTMKLKDTSLSVARTEIDKVNSELFEAIESINGSISDLDKAIQDGIIETFYQSTEPVGKIGDIWFNTSNGLAYRHDGSMWQSIQDKDVVKALEDAQNAQTTADGKIVSYYQKTEPASGSEGDLWIDIGNGNKLYRYTNGKWLSVQDENINKISSDLSNAVTNINQSFEDFKEAIEDGVIETFYQVSQPSNAKLGDLWYNTTTKKLSRFNGSTWDYLEDTKALEAIQKAESAQTTADGKIKTYYQKTEPQMTKGKDIGDLWVDIGNGNKLFRWDGSEWIDIQDKSIDKVASDLNNAISGVNSSITELEKAIEDGRIEIFYQPTEPTGTIGDLWYDTSVVDGVKSDKCYKHNGKTWELVKDSSVADAIKKAEDAQATADGKIVTFYQTTMPTNGSIGDLWIDTANGNKLYRHDGKTFVDVSDKTIEEIKDIVTNNKSDWDKIKDITDNLGNVIGNKITGGISLNNTQIHNANGRFLQDDNCLRWISADNNFASLWNENGIYFSNSKDSNGDWIWRNAIGNHGVVADKVVAEALYGLTVEALNLTSTNITGGSIKGVTIEGSTVYAGDRSSGNYTEITSEGVVNCYTNGLRTISLVRRPNGIIDVGRDIDGKNFMRINSDFSVTIDGTNVHSGMGISTQNNSQLIFDANRNRIIFNGDIFCTGRIVKKWNGGFKAGDYVEL